MIRSYSAGAKGISFLGKSALFRLQRYCFSQISFHILVMIFPIFTFAWQKTENDESQKVTYVICESEIIRNFASDNINGLTPRRQDGFQPERPQGISSARHI